MAFRPGHFGWRGGEGGGTRPGYPGWLVALLSGALTGHWFETFVDDALVRRHACPPAPGPARSAPGCRRRNCARGTAGGQGCLGVAGDDWADRVCSRSDGSHRPALGLAHRETQRLPGCLVWMAGLGAGGDQRSLTRWPARHQGNS